MNLTHAQNNQVKKLAKRRHLRLMYVFGSAARGDMHAGSDIDIAYQSVELLSESHRSEIASALYKILEPGRSPIDVVDLATAPPLLVYHIAREGRKLYGNALDDNLFYCHALERAIDARPLFELTTHYVHASLAI